MLTKEQRYDKVMGNYTIKDRYEFLTRHAIGNYRTRAGWGGLLETARQAVKIAITDGEWNNEAYKSVMRRTRGKFWLRGAFRVFYFRALAYDARSMHDRDRENYYLSLIGLAYGPKEEPRV